MSVELIKYAFSAGEISPSLYGRTDLEKYDMGMALTRNWFVDYRGGLSTRPGTEFLDYIKHPDREVKLMSFQFSSDIFNTYLLLFGHNYVRFVQDGAYVLSSPLNITGVSQAEVAVFTSVNHGLANNWWGKLSGISSVSETVFQIESVTTDTFVLRNVRTGVLLNSTDFPTYTGGGILEPIYEVATPYEDKDLAQLSGYAIRDLVRLTHPEFPISNLTRIDHADWLFQPEALGGLLGAPTGLSATASDEGDAALVWGVTAVYDDGRESELSIPSRLDNIINYTTEEGSAKFSWGRREGATHYNVYRSHIVGDQGESLSSGTDLGFLGTTRGTTFVDANIIPDFSRTPPVRHNPFAPGAITHVDVVSSGSPVGDFAPIITTSGDGTGFLGYGVTDDSGLIQNVVILSGGQGYVNPVFGGSSSGTGALLSGTVSNGAITSVTVAAGGSGYTQGEIVVATGGGGTGFSGFINVTAGEITSVTITNGGSGYMLFVLLDVGGSSSTPGLVLSATVAPMDGRNPSISTIFQQRQLYAASLNSPLTFWASRVGYFDDFSAGRVVIDSDYYEYEIDSALVDPILHMIQQRGGLLLMSQSGIWLLQGGSTGPVTPSNALADPQTYTGVSAVPPIRIGSDILYIEGKGYSVRLLSYNEFSRVYSGEDRSILSSHLIGRGKQIVEWAFAENPYKIVWGVREDGRLLAFTLVKEQDVYSWTWGETRGKFKNIIKITEEGLDRVYMVVEREVNGQWQRVLERMALRDFNNVEDAWAVDCGLKYEAPPVNATLRIGPLQQEGDLTFTTLTAGSAVFTGTEGYWIRAGGGVFVVKEVMTATTARAQVIRTPTNYVPEDPELSYFVVPANEWNLGPGLTTFSGLWHLEGHEVSILGDGSVFPKQVVSNGQITLPHGVTKVVIGLPFSCVAQTLPPTVTDIPIEARRKRIVGVGVRMHESRGLQTGPTLDSMYEFRERSGEPYGTPVLTLNGIRYMILPTDWDENGQTYFAQYAPLPASILGLVPDMEVGDDTD